MDGEERTKCEFVIVVGWEELLVCVFGQRSRWMGLRLGPRMCSDDVLND
jgi:hypothetical protein